MKVLGISKLAVAMFAALACLVSSANSANAQVSIQKSSPEGGFPPPQQVRVAPVVGSPMPGIPRLGFMGQMIHGYGMRVLSANYGSPAQQAGLERGDVIFSINGRRILCQFDYNNALQQAAMYQGGFVNLYVRNVRYDMGLSYQQFVNVSTRVIGGYGGGMPVPAAGSGSVAMPAVSGQGALGGVSAGASGGMSIRSATQSPQSATQSAKAAQRPQQVKEITAAQVPALRDGQKGSDQ